MMIELGDTRSTSNFTVARSSNRLIPRDTGVRLEIGDLIPSRKQT